LETRLVRSDLVTKGSFYEQMAEHGHEFISDDDYAELYSSGRGRPSIPPSVMVRAMLCATHDQTSDAETSRRTRVDLDWNAALGVDDDFAGVAPRTFSLMPARMLAADADNNLFEADLEMSHGRKSAGRHLSGHKMDLVSDEDSEMILGLDIRAGNAGDGEGPRRC
jgi:hypothetical protein